MQIRKRDGSFQDWDIHKVKLATAKAVEAAGELDRITEICEATVDAVQDLAETAEHEGSNFVDQEAIQDRVEEALMDVSPRTAKRYVLYREARAEKRALLALKPNPNMIADYIHPAKYGKWLATLSRREVFGETVDRSMNMHIAKFPWLETVIRDAFGLVRSKYVLPSMRSMQFAGERIRDHEAAMYNCSFSLCDRPRFFGEVFYLLLCGCGVGASVQKQHVAKLPKIVPCGSGAVRHFVVEDRIIGWADAVTALIDGAMSGYWVEFAYHKIRPEGTLLHKSGGRAPGHRPLRDCLEKLREILAGAVGRHLRPIEVGDMICFIAMAVLSGGIRRSSIILIFSPDDEEMLTAKSEAVFRYPRGIDPGLNAQRQMSNNSAALLRGQTEREEFNRLFDLSKAAWGDPGIYWTEDLDYGTNPCGEIGLNPTITWEQITQMGETFEVSCERFDRATGWSFCNLCEVNVARCLDETEFLAACDAAAFIGTLQASYTNIPYLGPVTAAIMRREALLGVGMTGIMDNIKIGLNPELLRRGAEVAVRSNKTWAREIGIRPAARVTTVKPSGTASLELGCVGSGIHPHHAERYFRRVTANPLEPVAQYLYEKNPGMFTVKPDGDWSVCFPVMAPAGAVTVKKQTAAEFLDCVMLVFENWIKPGCARPESSEGLSHNVSATVNVRDEEWDYVRDRLWEERRRYNAVSFMSMGNDKAVPFMPREEVVTEADWAIWKTLIETFVPVDYTGMVETEDLTVRVSEAACSGGVCDIVEGAMLRRFAHPGAIMLFHGPWEGNGKEEDMIDVDGEGSMYWFDASCGSWWLLPVPGDIFTRTAVGGEYCWAVAVRGRLAAELDREREGRKGGKGG